MAEEFDVNKVAAELVERTIEKSLDAGKGMFKGAAAKIRLRMRASYKAYLSCVLDRYSKAKSFYIRREPTYLYDFYVPVGVSCGRKHIRQASARTLFAISRFLVITASAGSGKSMLMRHLLLTAAQSQGKIPVFIELRTMEDPTVSLIEQIYRTLKANKLALEKEYIHEAMKMGNFAFFLDGFDEIGISTRKSTAKQILGLSEFYDGNEIVVSSRPDDEFSGWQGFTVCDVDPLTLDQACALVEKIPVDPETKSNFIRDLAERLFEDHRSFLSNPLLLSIMLMTYQQNADIPNKLSLFYSQAFDALFHQHDALKGGFKRKRACALDIQDYGKVFAAFSLLTYDKRVFEFSRPQALDFLEKSKKISGLEFDTIGYLEDSLRAVSLLIEDGMFIRFTHRSFQEFFVAKFINGASRGVQEKLIWKYEKDDLDDVVDLLYEMNPELVEQVYLLPAIERLMRRVGGTDKVGLTSYLCFVKTCYSSLYMSEEHDEEGEIVECLSAILKRSDEAAEFMRLVDFADQHLIRLVGRSRTIDLANDDALKTYLAGGRQVNTQDLTPEHPLTSLIAASGSWLSSELDMLLQIRETLIERRKRAEDSLDEILGA